MCTSRHHFAIEVGRRLFEHDLRGVGRLLREEAEVPVEAAVVVVAIEELDLLEGFRAWQIAGQLWMQAEK